MKFLWVILLLITLAGCDWFKGDRGEDGESGLNGIRGIAGLVGPGGLDGSEGPRGEKGQHGHHSSCHFFPFMVFLNSIVTEEPKTSDILKVSREYL